MGKKRDFVSRRKTIPSFTQFLDNQEKQVDVTVKRKKSVKFNENAVKGEQIVNNAMQQPTLQDLCKLAMANQEILKQLEQSNKMLKERISGLEKCKENGLVESWVL